MCNCLRRVFIVSVTLICPAIARGELGGPTIHAPHQVTGALSGVVVFLEPGHGWYESGLGWQLQRPYLYLMVEDYGNLDQLNYLVHYVHNAGGIVVPLRPAGYQKIEVILDNDDPGVTYNGAWADSSDTEKYYENEVTNSGVPFRTAGTAAVESATARYTPDIPVAGIYPVYCFTKHGTDRVEQRYRIDHRDGTTDMRVDHRMVGNGWVWLGEYWFDAGTNGYVEISNESPDSGVVVADAIRWGVGMGSTVGNISGTVSGRPRDEEDAFFWARTEAIVNGVGFENIPSLQTFNAAAVWAREMNATATNNDRWRRIYLSLHSNAVPNSGTGRGTFALVDGSNPTLNQELFATMLGDEVEMDMVLQSDQLEFPWALRANPFEGSYPQISANYNGDEYDATLIEVAFHDNSLDAALLRDSRVRAAVSRSIVQGLIKFLNTLPDSTVPLAFPPDRPTSLAVLDDGGGDVRVIWDAPPFGEAEGDPATGYIVYGSTDGLGFAPIATVGDVREAVFIGVPVGEPRYYRMAATNAGGESMPTETLVVCRPQSGVGDVLIVNGYDRLRQEQNPFFFEGIQQIMTRPLWRQINTYDYVRFHAAALQAAEAGVGFASCSNEAVQTGSVSLADYAVVDWLCGDERHEDATFNAAEQAAVTTYLTSGGAIFISGAQIGFDLVDQQNGPEFFHDVLGADFVEYFSNTYNVAPTPGALFDGLPAFDFNPANGAAYRVRYPEKIAPRPFAQSILDFVGGYGGHAGIELDGVTYRVVLQSVPLETITSDVVRGQLMERVLARLREPAILFDADRDGDVDLSDATIFPTCTKGPVTGYGGVFCRFIDGDADGNVDLADYGEFQRAFVTP